MTFLNQQPALPSKKQHFLSVVLKFFFPTGLFFATGFFAFSGMIHVQAEEFETPVLVPTQHSERGYTVHYSVFNSHFIPANIARAYNLIRGKKHVLINIVLTKTGKESESLGLAADVKGIARNLMQQRQTLKFQTINEEKTTYFLAPLRISNEEIFHFDIEVTPPDGSRPITVKFSKKLYVDH